MKTTVENLDPSRIKLTVEVPYEELKPSLDAAYKEIGSQIQVPGFRRGHVPNRVIDQRVGRGTVIQEAVNNKLSDFYRDAITEAERVPMLQPEVDVVELPNATGENGGQLAFTAEVTVRPVIELPDLSKAKLTVDAVEVTDEDVDTELDNLRARFGSLKSVAIAPAEIESAFAEGVGFDGSSIEGYARVYESDMVAHPDPSTFQMLPWRQGTGTARMFCDIANPDGFATECAQGRDLGFDGKTLIHPSQIDACNVIFTPPEEEVARARKIIAAFELPENASRGAIRLDGAMVERLHADMARRTIEIADAIAAMSKG